MITWAVTVSYLRAAWVWLKNNTHFVLLCIIGYFTGAALLRRKDSQITNLKEAVAAQKHKTEVERLKGKTEELKKLDATSVARDKVLADEIAVIEHEKIEHQRRLLALHNKQLDPNTMTDAEVEEHFRAAGL
jgi:hypothetical protein